MKAMSKRLAEKAALALKKRRIAIGWKQTEAAARAGVALGTLQKFEQTGNISIERFFRLCYIYNMEYSMIHAIESRDNWALEEIKRADSKRIVR
jgi:transcriptional regulator with XRE-family HTH domain